MRALIVVLVLMVAFLNPARAQDARDNIEMAAIFAADQEVRKNWSAKTDFAAVIKADEARRRATKDLFDAGKLVTGTDYWHAAFVFQHGGTSDDYLLAHTLEIIAAAKGRADATWIAAATLDRYLRSIGQPQIYGTQYSSRAGSSMTQEPFNAALISDGLRKEMRVPVLSEQEKRRAELDARRDK